MPQWYEDGTNPPELLNGWLTLCMDRAAMEVYASRITAGTEKLDRFKEPLSPTLIQRAVDRCVSAMNASNKFKFALRLAKQNDVDTIFRLVYGLAVYEKEPDAVSVKAEHYSRDGFSDQPLFYCLLVDYTDSSGQVTTCGMALCYFGFSLGDGRFLYLEDLFFEEEYRKLGGGTMLMAALACIGLSVQCDRFFWQALDWNTPALTFYNQVGATIQEGVLTARYKGNSLKRFAGEI